MVVSSDTGNYDVGRLQLPYRYAYLFVLFVLGLTIVAFWPSYFSRLGTAPFAFHAHGLVTTSWLCLVAMQSWFISRGSTLNHRRAGLGSMFLFPLLIATFVMIINVSAARFLAGDNPFFLQVGPILGFVMLSAIVAYLLLFAMALRYRNNVRIHALCMLATAVILAESATGRLLQHIVPTMSFDGTGEFRGALDSIVIPDMLVAAVAIVIYLRNKADGWPFLLVGVLFSAQIVAIYSFADSAWLRQAFESYARMPGWVPISIGLAFGCIAAWAGWTFPARVNINQPQRRAGDC